MKILRALKVAAFLVASFPALAQGNSYHWYFETENSSFAMRACCPDGNTCSGYFLASGTYLSCSQEGNARVHSPDGTQSFQVNQSSCGSTSNTTRITIRYNHNTGNYSYTTGCL